MYIYIYNFYIYIFNENYVRKYNKAREFQIIVVTPKVIETGLAPRVSEIEHPPRKPLSINKILFTKVTAG